MKHLIKTIETLTLVLAITGFFLLFTNDFRVQIIGMLLFLFGAILGLLFASDAEDKEANEC